jgi:hypothetical protein
MNSNQIDKILAKNQYTKHNFIGVYSVDTIPEKIPHYPCSFVCNNKKLGHPGEHWLAFFIPDPHSIEIFDSLAKDLPLLLKKYIEKYPNIKKNKRKVQESYETSCGPHVIYFIIMRSLGYSFEQIIKKLSDKMYRDAFVKFFTANLI